MCKAKGEHLWQHSSTDLLSLLEGEEFEVQVVWELDMRDTNFWMVLRDGALIRELRRLWYFWNKLSTWTWTTPCKPNLNLILYLWFVWFCLKCASLFLPQSFWGSFSRAVGQTTPAGILSAWQKAHGCRRPHDHSCRSEWQQLCICESTTTSDKLNQNRALKNFPYKPTA